MWLCLDFLCALPLPLLLFVVGASRSWGGRCGVWSWPSGYSGTECCSGESGTEGRELSLGQGSWSLVEGKEGGPESSQGVVGVPGCLPQGSRRLKQLRGCLPARAHPSILPASTTCCPHGRPSSAAVKALTQECGPFASAACLCGCFGGIFSSLRSPLLLVYPKQGTVL